MMKKIIYSALLLLACSCSDFLKEYSQDLVVAKSVTDYDELMLGSVYMPSYPYSTRRLPSGTASCAFLNVLDDDIDMVKGESVLGDVDVWMYSVKACFGYYAWQLEVGRSLDGASEVDDNATWNDLYTRINLLNVILDEIGDISVKTDQEKSDRIRIQGECHFLRAQFYLVLVNLYGDAYAPSTAAETLGVPLKLTGYVEHEQGKPTQFDRAPLTEVYAQIVADLKASVQCLSESPQTHSYYRVSEQAARLLLSRVYLYMQDWENAREAARELLALKPMLSDMSTMNDSTSVFLSEDSEEILFSQGSLTTQSILTGHAGDYCVSGDLYDCYDHETDKRSMVFFGYTGSGDSVSLKGKFKRGDHQSRVSDILMLRSAEAYLNMAEACAMLGDPEANQWLNGLRRKRITGYLDRTYAGEELIGQVRLERRRELCFEGHRWFDLRRYAACETHPYKREITHVFHVYSDNRFIYESGQGYVLKMDDPAYTFAIPKKVIEFDLVGMPNNKREKRSPEWITVWGDED